MSAALAACGLGFRVEEESCCCCDGAAAAGMGLAGVPLAATLVGRGWLLESCKVANHAVQSSSNRRTSTLVDNQTEDGLLQLHVMSLYLHAVTTHSATP
jgi:hypothetical protein